MSSNSRLIKIYDTTLRDGMQAEDISFTVEDKIRITFKLDELGVHYVEGGWPGSNPKDIQYFKEIINNKPECAKIVSFGSTRRKDRTCEDDKNIQELLASGTDVITIFGKSWDLHVKEALEIAPEDNLNIIYDSVSYLRKYIKEIIYDAEHFFDGYKSNPQYAVHTLNEAVKAGADWIILCDTNGGTMPHEIAKIVGDIKDIIKVPLGIHAHNDSEVAVANSIVATNAGCSMVHGTINGYGERCGNANLCSIIPNIKLKLGLDCISDKQMTKLVDISMFVDELANKRHWIHQPYVGKSAFAHKGGIHVSAIRKNPVTYEHIKPELVGNHQRVLVSDLSGKSNILYKAEEYGIDLKKKDYVTQKILSDLKELESQGFQFEGAEASFELLMRKALGMHKKFFKLIGFRVIVEKRREGETCISEATIKLMVDEKIEHTAAEGNGPVNALDNALKKSLEKFYPEIKDLSLYDYKVRILDEWRGTMAKTRVLIESGDKRDKWGTVGLSDNIIEASWQALVDSMEYKLHKERD